MQKIKGGRFFGGGGTRYVDKADQTPCKSVGEVFISTTRQWIPQVDKPLKSITLDQSDGETYAYLPSRT